MIAEVGDGGAVGRGEAVADGVERAIAATLPAVVEERPRAQAEARDALLVPGTEHAPLEALHRTFGQELQGHVHGMRIPRAHRPEGLGGAQDLHFHPVAPLPEPFRVLDPFPVIHVGVAQEDVYAAHPGEPGLLEERPSQGGEASARVEDEQVLAVEHRIAGSVVADSRTMRDEATRASAAPDVELGRPDRRPPARAHSDAENGNKVLPPERGPPRLGSGIASGRAGVYKTMGEKPYVQDRRD